MNASASFAIVLLVFVPGASAQESSVRPQGEAAEAVAYASVLPLRLVGVLRDLSAQGRAAALIQCGSPVERRPASLFAAGDRACDVAEITQVLEDAIVVRNLATNRLEQVTLRRASATPRAPVPDEERRLPERSLEPLPQPVVLPASGDVVTVELRQELIDRSMANLTEVLSSALATPHMPGNGSSSVDGYEVSRIKPGGIVDQLGLRDGDVILEVNGQPMNSLGAVTGLLGRAQAMDGARMSVLRSGRTLTFVFSVR
jgi:hypothetical protein